MNHTIGILFLMNHEALLNWLIRQFPTYIIFRECYFSTMKSNQKSPAYVKWAKSVSISLKKSNAPLPGLPVLRNHAVWIFFNAVFYRIFNAHFTEAGIP